MNQTATATRPTLGTILDGALLLAGLLLLALRPHEIGSDGQTRYETLNALLSRGEILPTKYPLVGPLFAAPLWLLGWVTGDPRRWCHLYNFVVFALGLPVLYALLRALISDAARRRFLLLLVFASMFPHHTLHFFGEVFSAVLAAVGMAALVRGRGGWGWPCLVLATANMPPSGVGLALVALVWAVSTHRWRHLLAVPAAAVCVGLETCVRLGIPIRSGYAGDHGYHTVLPYSGSPGFSYPLFFGLLSVLFSFGKGLLFFAPGLLVPVPVRTATPPARALWGLWLLFVVGLVLVYARWWAWYGGWFWGPRFFLFAALPAALSLAVAVEPAPGQSLGRNLFALAALLLSFWVGFNGLLFRGPNPELFFRNDYALEHLTWYVPEFSALWHPFVDPAAYHVSALTVTLVGVLYAVCFLRVAAPLLTACVRQIRDAWRLWRETERGRWRF